MALNVANRAKWKFVVGVKGYATEIVSIPGRRAGGMGSKRDPLPLSTVVPHDLTLPGDSQALCNTTE